MNPPKPYYQDDACTIYHGDCREILPHLPKVDLVLTDPPYGIGIAKNPVRQAHKKMDWDSAPPDFSVIQACVNAGEYAIIWGGELLWAPSSPMLFGMGQATARGL